MQITELNIVGKSPKKKSEDGIVVTDDFVAVIDGSTSKARRRYSLLASNGRYAMLTVARFLRRAPKQMSCHEFCVGATRAIASKYPRRIMAELTEHPEERLAASCVVFSRLRREVWLVGDCQCLIGNTFYDNPKPYEQPLAEQRARIIEESGLPREHFLTDDTARAAIIPLMLEQMKRQNKDYAVIDGFPIAEQHVKVLTLDFQPWEIVLASDGYPCLKDTLEESERQLQLQKESDPLNIGQFKATKAFMEGNNSFDDRAYVRFTV